MFNGKMKALTFSFDDGVTQDLRLVSLMNKYGLKSTFNINSALLGGRNTLERDGVTVLHNKIMPSAVRTVYAGHEIAAHTLTHPTLTGLADDPQEVVRQVEADRQLLSALAGYEVVGFAYPGGGVNYSPEIAELVRKTGVGYARTTVLTESFDLQDDLFMFRPTMHAARFDELNALARDFIRLDPDTPKLFYIWGHSYEFDIHDTWAQLEDFFRRIAWRDDICYCTNKEALLGV